MEAVPFIFVMNLVLFMLDTDIKDTRHMIRNKQKEGYGRARAYRYSFKSPPSQLKQPRNEAWKFVLPLGFRARYFRGTQPRRSTAELSKQS